MSLSKSIAVVDDAARNGAPLSGETIGTDETPIGRIKLDRTAVGVESKAVYRVMLEARDG